MKHLKNNERPAPPSVNSLELRCDDFDSDDNAQIIYFTADDLKDIDATSGMFTFVNKDNVKVIFRERKVYTFNYNAF